jgi:arabinose-5-phosphate isomerase
MNQTLQSKYLLEELVERQRDALSDFFKNLCLPDLEKVLDKLASCQGLIHFTGVGKSGLIAQKISQTMTSIGTRALFLDPTNALHGDLGMAKEGDLVVMLSKSGESQELLEMIPYLRNRNVETVGIFFRPQCRLSNGVDLALILPQVPEICPFDLAPTTSTTAQAIIGDILAVALMRKKKISIEDFASSHPAGRIGKRISLKVSDLMLQGKDLPLCSTEDKLVDLLVELSNKKCGCLLVVNDKRELLGIFTDGDLRRSLQLFGPTSLQMQVGELMTHNPRTCTPQMLAVSALEMMESIQKNPITVLPVLVGQELVGLIRMHDIVQTGI